MYVKMIQDGVFVIPEGFRVLIPLGPYKYNTKEAKECHGWYDVQPNMSPYDKNRYNEADQLESLQTISELIRQEALDIHNGDFSKVFLSGFSQGCFMSLLYGLLSKDPLPGGIIGFCGLVPPLFFRLLEEQGEKGMEEWKIKEKAEKLRILHYNGMADPLFIWDNKINEQIDAVWTKLGFKHF